MGTVNAIPLVNHFFTIGALVYCFIAINYPTCALPAWWWRPDLNRYRVIPSEERIRILESTPTTNYPQTIRPPDQVLPNRPTNEINVGIAYTTRSLLGCASHKSSHPPSARKY